MDQKRTLWITIAVGVFLLVVVGSAAILYAPAAKQETQIAKSIDDEIWISPTVISSVPKDNFAQGIATPSTDQKNTIQDNSSQTDVIPQNNLTNSSTGDSQLDTIVTKESSLLTDNVTVIANGTTNVISTEGTPTVTTIDLNSLKSSNSNVLANNTVAANAMKETATYNDSAMIKKQETVTSKTTSVKPVEKKTEKKVEKKSTPIQKTVTKEKPITTKPADQFWVQAASYSTKKNADDARAVLESEKIQCDVFTYKDNKGKLFFRVRVGPYSTKSEAEYWKNKIVSIDLFKKSGSYVTNSSAAKK